MIFIKSQSSMMFYLVMFIIFDSLNALLQKSKKTKNL